MSLTSPKSEPVWQISPSPMSRLGGWHFRFLGQIRVIAGLLALALVAPPVVAHAEELGSGLYRLAEEGKGTRVERNDGWGHVSLGERLSEGLGKATIRSIENDNSRFRLELAGAGPIEAGADQGHFAVIVAGECLAIDSHSDRKPDGSIDLGATFVGEDAATKIATALGTKAKLRRHPGHRLLVRFRPEKRDYAPGDPVTLVLTIQNVGERVVRFRDGGRQRGPRNNQFGFTAFENAGYGPAVPDIGDPTNFGGPMGFIELAPGKTFTKTVNLSDWFQFKKPDGYKITGMYALELNEQRDDATEETWDDFAVGTCFVGIKAPVKDDVDPRQPRAAGQRAGESEVEGNPNEEATRDDKRDLPALMMRHKPPYVRPDGPPDPAITFERVDVVIERGYPGPAQTPYLSIGRDSSYAYILNTVNLPAGRSFPGAALVGRLPPPRMAELQRLLAATQWLAAPGGEGPAVHTHADRMTLAVTRDGKTHTILLNGVRPAPYAALQKYLNDLALQEHYYYRITWLPDERSEAIRALHEEVESALKRPGRSPLRHDLSFDRYYDLFAADLDGWATSETDKLRTAIDLMVLLKRDELAPTIARLRNDRDGHLRKSVALALPALLGQQAIPLLVDMAGSTAEARVGLINMGAPAIPAIVSLIEPEMPPRVPLAVPMIRSYIDHWKQLPKPIDPRVLEAVKANMQHESERNIRSIAGPGVQFHEELLKLATATEP